MPHMLSARKRKTSEVDDEDLAMSEAWMMDNLYSSRKKAKLIDERAKKFKRETTLEKLKRERLAKAAAQSGKVPQPTNDSARVAKTVNTNHNDLSREEELQAIELRMIERGDDPELINYNMARHTRDGRFKRTDPDTRKKLVATISKHLREANEARKQGKEYHPKKTRPKLKTRQEQNEKERLDFLAGNYDTTHDVFALPKTHSSIARNPCDPRDTIVGWKSDLERNNLARWVPPNRRSGALALDFEPDPKTGGQRPRKGVDKFFSIDDKKMLKQMRKSQKRVLSGQPSPLQGYRGLALACRVTTPTSPVSRNYLKKLARRAKGKTDYAAYKIAERSSRVSLKKKLRANNRAANTPITTETKPRPNSKPLASKQAKTAATSKPASSKATTSKPATKRATQAPVVLSAPVRQKSKVTTKDARPPASSRPAYNLAPNYQATPPVKRAPAKGPPENRYKLSENKFTRKAT